jgi:hypothetical protein
MVADISNNAATDNTALAMILSLLLIKTIAPRETTLYIITVDDCTVTRN